MSDVLTTRGLAVGYGEKLILTDINLQLHQGEIICLLGANGCGKTTLMKTLLGLLPPKARRSALITHRCVTGVPPHSPAALPMCLRRTICRFLSG